MDIQYKNAWIKARLLSGRTVNFSDKVEEKNRKMDVENHHREEWIFIKLGEESRVRLVVDVNPAFWIDVDEDDNLYLYDACTKECVLPKVIIEEVAIHAPQQLFLGLYEYCKIGCRFCPLSLPQNVKIHYSLDSIFYDIDASKDKEYTSIGITTAIPYNLSSEDVADEMIFTVSKIREKVGEDIPIGISTRIPSIDKLKALRTAGASEARLNIEIPNPVLAKELMPNKSIDEIMMSIRNACDVFGRGKVSSNIVLGLGETDSEVLQLIERLAEAGAIATLYPFDEFSGESCSKQFSRPSAERLYALAVEHKKILERYSLNPNGLLTMCPACAASHIYPGKDL